MQNQLTAIFVPREQVPGACFSRVDPTPLDNPQLVALSSSALKLIDVDETETDDQQFVQYFGGNKIIPGTMMISHDERIYN